MTIYSMIQKGIGLQPIEVEVSLIRGLPQMHILGLPDPSIKECQWRIKTAFKAQKFDFPTHQQVVVNLRPSHLKKTSKGLDFAIAAAILWKSGQVEPPSSKSISLYGELSLDGKVSAPEDLNDIVRWPNSEIFMTGDWEETPTFEVFKVSNLNSLSNPIKFSDHKSNIEIHRPRYPQVQLSKDQFDLCALATVGEHPTLFAGPQGTGKTTLAEVISSVRPHPSSEELRLSRIISRRFGRPLEWRPICRPHHTSTALALIGGGSPPIPGEISRAHNGSLIMDEYLEFDRKVQEALREPLESQKLTVARAGYMEEFPANFLLLATTNLCPCGELYPGPDHKCRCQGTKVKNYLSRLSGPMLDRFAIVGLSNFWGRQPQKIPSKNLVRKVEEGVNFRIKTRNQTFPNQKLSISEIQKQICPFALKKLWPKKFSSKRRELAMFRVARTAADLRVSEKIDIQDLDLALKWAKLSFDKLKNDTYQYL